MDYLKYPEIGHPRLRERVNGDLVSMIRVQEIDRQEHAEQEAFSSLDVSISHLQGYLDALTAIFGGVMAKKLYDQSRRNSGVDDEGGA